jgi:acyl carrier protein
MRLTTRAELISAVTEELSTQLALGDRPVAESDVLRDLPNSESVHLFRVAAKLERTVGVELDDAGLFAVRTVGDLVDLLANAMSA